MAKFKLRKLKRDLVISVMPYGERVGVYLIDEPNNLLAEMTPELADKIISLWNNQNFNN